MWTSAETMDDHRAKWRVAEIREVSSCSTADRVGQVEQRVEQCALSGRIQQAIDLTAMTTVLVYRPCSASSSSITQEHVVLCNCFRCHVTR